MEATLDGEQILSIRDVHSALAAAFDFGPYYGFNSAALWDRLSTDVPRPVTVRWVNSALSRDRLGSEFDAVVGIFEDVVRLDADAGLVDRFTFSLE